MCPIPIPSLSSIVRTVLVTVVALKTPFLLQSFLLTLIDVRALSPSAPFRPWTRVRPIPLGASLTLIL